MTTTLRGADILALSLERLGISKVFTLSGNHIMSIFDAALETKLHLIHTRHEAAAVHMADGFGRMTGACGIAMVTGGPGHANAVGALFTARAAESPMVLLSGHAATWELGRGGFQELDQAAMAAPVTKASWMARSAAGLGEDLAEAMRIARSGRPGPVHLSLPSDLLEERVPANAVRWPEAKAADPEPMPLGEAAAALVARHIVEAERPLLIAGPALSSARGRALLSRLEAAALAPAVVMESPRGLKDATLGAFMEVHEQADLIVLVGKAFDFTLRRHLKPGADRKGRLIAIDPEGALIERVQKEKGSALLLGLVADAAPAAEALIRALGEGPSRDGRWRAEARRLLDGRPEAWAAQASKTPGRLHPAEVFRSLKPFLERDPDSVLVLDGGEFAQWGQSLVTARRRLVNGVAGAIGGSLSFALASRLIEPKAPVFVVLGDGTFGFHMAEFDTAVREKLPFVAILGNDQCWNAESQIQLREYGQQRMHGCALLPTRYDEVVKAMGGHGELVTRTSELEGALTRALASGKPACVNIMTESIPAPMIKL
jgi:acetolactate synthase-1/2/3 large subunit